MKQRPPSEPSSFIPSTPREEYLLSAWRRSEQLLQLAIAKEVAATDKAAAAEAKARELQDSLRQRTMNFTAALREQQSSTTGITSSAFSPETNRVGQRHLTRTRAVQVAPSPEVMRMAATTQTVLTANDLMKQESQAESRPMTQAVEVGPDVPFEKRVADCEVQVDLVQQAIDSVVEALRENYEQQVQELTERAEITEKKLDENRVVNDAVEKLTEQLRICLTDQVRYREERDVARMDLRAAQEELDDLDERLQQANGELESTQLALQGAEHRVSEVSKQIASLTERADNAEKALGEEKARGEQAAALAGAEAGRLTGQLEQAGRQMEHMSQTILQLRTQIQRERLEFEGKLGEERAKSVRLAEKVESCESELAILVEQLDRERASSEATKEQLRRLIQ